MSGVQICGCCDGITAQTPARVDNRPGLATIDYRVRTWAQFKSSMLDRLSTVPELAALRTRSDDDFTIALLDAWAIVCDILTFYQERIANESYLRTATERMSIGELARLIGYKLRPGVAASVALAFTLDAPIILPPGPSSPPSGAPAWVTLDAGLRVQSIPDPGQQPATFETSAPIAARSEWNAISPRLHRTPDGGADNAASNVRLKGLQAGLQVGDYLLLVARESTSPTVQRIARLELDNDTQTTLVHFEDDRSPDPAPLPTAVPSPISASLDDAFLWANVKDHVWSDQTQLVAFAQSQKWSLDALNQGINALRGKSPPGVDAPLRVFTLTTRASLFGHNAPLWKSLPASFRYASSVQKLNNLGKPIDEYTVIDPPFSQPGWDVHGTLEFDQTSMSTTDTFATLDLDSTYPSLVAGGWLVLVSADYPVFGTFAARILQSRELSRSDYLLSAKVTRVRLDASPDYIQPFPIRTTHVLGSTGELEVADIVDDTEVDGTPLMLDAAYLSLKIGQLVAVTGIRAEKQDETASEVVAINALALVDGYTMATFVPALTRRYTRATVRLDANLAPATHGETRSEILGSGDARRPFQRFVLKQAPLTYISASTETGAAATLAVRVNGVLWQETAWLYGLGPTDRVYVIVNDGDGKTYVQFGDGATGARLPSGTNNVQATYRVGIGRAGNVRAGQLSTLLSRPLGLKAATNPLASSGADDPETLEQARDNAPVTIRTLGRIVSLEDFADFARSSAGIARASVTWLWDGTREIACVTVAGPGGAAVMAGTPQYDNLLAAMQAAGDGCVPTALCAYVPRTFTISATLTADPTLIAASVLDVVKTALHNAFSFESREFSQPVYRSEVIAIAQNVPGVVALTLTKFAYTGSTSTIQPDALIAKAPTLGVNGSVGAEQLTLDGGPLPGVVVRP